MRRLKTEGSLFQKDENFDTEGPYLLDTPKTKQAEEFIKRSRSIRKSGPLEDF